MKTRFARTVVRTCLVVVAVTLSVSSAAAQAPGAPPLTEDSLGEMLQTMGLKFEKTEKRYDFSFKARHEGEDWKLSMSTVLSQNGRSMWVMAWLDEIPSTESDVPRTSLLRLLALNDRMGKGKFFAYIPSNRRFVLQRVVPNRGITSRGLQSVLQDVGYSVVETYPHWSVANWRADTRNYANTKVGTPKNSEAPVPLPREQSIRTSTRQTDTTVR